MNTPSNLHSFEEQHEQLIQGIDAIDELKKHARNSAYQWQWGFGKDREKILKKFMDEISEDVLNLGVEFSEQKEQMIRVTYEELMGNSISACDEREDRYITAERAIGSKGVVLKISDDGPGFNHAYEVEKRRLHHNDLTPDRVLYHRHEVGFPGGAGMYCLLNFCDEFHFNENGNEVCMRIKFTD